MRRLTAVVFGRYHEKVHVKQKDKRPSIKPIRHGRRREEWGAVVGGVGGSCTAGGLDMKKELITRLHGQFEEFAQVEEGVEF